MTRQDFRSQAAAGRRVSPAWARFYGVSSRFVFKLLSEFDPEQFEAISLSAAAFVRMAIDDCT